MSAEPPAASPPPPLPLLYRDPFLLAVDKPSGLLVHRGWGRDRVTALDLARHLAGCRVYPLHRLDRGTSGVLVFALDPTTAGALGERFADGSLDKRYLALVRGVAPEEAVVDHPIPRAPGGPRVPAVTAVRRLGWAAVEGTPLGHHAHYSLVEARPASGRLHQVRRHLKHLGHPVIGDVNYGKGEHNRLFRERFALHRLALHALEITLPHPATGEALHLAAPVPEDLAAVLEALGLPRPAAGLDAGR